MAYLSFSPSLVTCSSAGPCTCRSLLALWPAIQPDAPSCVTCVVLSSAIHTDMKLPALLLSLVVVAASVEGKQLPRCTPCELVRCAGGPETMKCAYGIVKDFCGCCYTCGQPLGSPCGHKLGTCGEGLVCSPSRIQGTCVPSPTTVKG
nr:serine protease HTRA1-like [Procambarus clarkii]